MIKYRHTALIGAVAATGLAVIASIYGGDTLNLASYIPTILASSVAAVVFMVLTLRAWGQRPPGEMIAWVFGHLCLWSAAFALEEIGWFIWRFNYDGQFALFFAASLAPALKAIQATAIIGLLMFAWLSHRSITGAQLSVRLRFTWMTCMLLSAFTFTMVRVFLG